ncbi:MAG: hypothetical protein KKE55_05330 [Candidatus Omnitrophica bacterium]|nr:hypothetical protein [Candidatus Omnitrophota bacterium]MBU1524429.1 hypothetical protein [Candidatus Omnitrophota bacterium]MBU2437100.1 hypothetical protein [Candidatus Omnitrophota bacterium]MBU2504530.1 hypothetical protein [Candidatus Omnitrophota bacterium]
MEVKLESLIEKIKKEGVEEAMRAAQEIAKEAQDKAQEIINEAQAQAGKIIDEAKKEADKLKYNSELAIKQAGRDLILRLREEISRLFSNVLKRSLTHTLTPQFLGELVVKIVDQWLPQKETQTIEIIVNDKDKQKLEELILSQLKKEAGDRLEIKINNNIDCGFRIGIKGEDVYYDFTDESILESLKEFLNPTVSALLDSINGVNSQ